MYFLPMTALKLKQTISDQCNKKSCFILKQLLTEKAFIFKRLFARKT